MSPSERQDTRKTTFRTASDLRRLIEVASFDNVQPQAILAAQALGRRLQVSPALKDRAILALNRRDSVRWDNLNLTIGLNDSPLIEMIQNSDPLLAFFLFVCAWKPCFTDSEVADLAFEMMELSEILDKFPVVASSQLCELIKVFSGHCEDLAPIDIMYRLAIEVHAPSLDADNLYMGLTSWSLADALLQLFDLLGDDSVGSITLSGCTGGILLATAFLWLNPEATSVSIDGELLNGHDGNSKLRFAFKTRPADFSDYGKWTIEKRNGELSTLEVEAKSDEPIDCFTYIPIKFTRLFLSPSFLVYLKFPIRSRAIQTVGEVAGALIVLLTEFGSIYAPQPCCEESETECTKTFLRDLFHHNWMTRYSSAIQEYGWTESTVNGQDMAVALLQPVFAKLSAQAADEEQFWKGIEEAGGHYIRSRLGADPTDYEEEDDEEVATNSIFQTASYIAFHAILTATCLLVSGTRRISLPLYSVGHSCRSLLSPSGMSISNFSKYALTQILPGNFSFDFDDIVASSNGYVAGISSFWQVSMQKRDALTLRVVLGVIKREGSIYDGIREVCENRGVPRSRAEENVEHVELLQVAHNLGLRYIDEQEDLKIEKRITVVGRKLELRTHLDRCMCYFRPLSWRRSIHGVATAIHFDETHEDARRREEFIKGHSKELPEAYWQSIGKWSYWDTERKTILKCHKNEELRFFSCGTLHYERQMFEESDPQCLPIIIRHSGSLLSAVLAAEETSRTWAMIG